MKHDEVTAALDLLTQAADKLSTIAHDVCVGLLDDELVSGIIADTNADGWHVDQIELDAIEFAWDKDVKLNPIIHVTFSMAGDHDDEKMFHGDAIDGTCKIALLPDGTYDVSDVEAKVRELDDEEDDDGESGS